MKTIVKHHLFWPAAALITLVVVNILTNPNFAKITIRDGDLYGNPVTILRESAPLMLVALGMTIVIATRGIDLSVGAVMAVSGAVSLTIIADSPDPTSLGTVAIAVLVAVVVALVLGAWNGFLVSVLGIQPIIATLVLMLAGRGVALLITGGSITTVTSDPYKFLSNGYLILLPVAFFIWVAVVAIVALVERRTALGMLTEAVGINPEASRLAGVRSRGIVWSAYILSGVLAGVAGIINASNTMAADANSAGYLIELYAILAVVLGGTSLMGGKFSIAGTVIGVLTVTTLDKTIQFMGVPPAQSPVFFAVVVVLVVLLQSPRVHHWGRSVGARLSRTPHEPPSIDHDPDADRADNVQKEVVA
jgi:ribose/xylose/arabinose/galactoside ABC-type transport system permease subunit